MNSAAEEYTECQMEYGPKLREVVLYTTQDGLTIQKLVCYQNTYMHTDCINDKCTRPHTLCDNPDCSGAHGNSVGSLPRSAKYCLNGPVSGNCKCTNPTCGFNHARDNEEFIRALKHVPGEYGEYTQRAALGAFLVERKPRGKGRSQQRQRKQQKKTYVAK